MSRILGLVSWGAASVAVVVAAFELTVRVDDWAQHRVPITAPAVSIADLVVRDSLGFHARAGGQFRQFRINSAGFRGPEVDLGDTSSLRVATAGASETFGLYEPKDKEWPRQLEGLLRSECRQAVTVLNAAFAGMALPTVQQDYERRLRRLSPRMVVYYPTPMQYLEGVELPKASPPGGPPAPLSAWRARAVPRLRDALKRAVPEPMLDILRQLDTQRQLKAAGTTAKPRAEPERLEAFDRDLRALVGAYRGGGSEPVLVIHRHRFRDTTSVEDRRLLRAWERFYPRYTAGALLQFDDQAAERIVRLGRDSSVTVVDPLPALASLGGAAFADFSHFTEKGSEAMARVIAGAIQPMLCR
jgi:hypothetical protein